MVKDKRLRTALLDWPKEKTFQLISAMEEHPCLWDIQSNHYRDRSVRDRAWENVAQTLEYPKVEVNNKWTLLRQQFRNTHKTTSSRAPNEFYTAMHFMEAVFSNDTDTSESYADALSIPNKIERLSADENSESNYNERFEDNLDTSSASSDAHQKIPAKRKKLIKEAIKESNLETTGLRNETFALEGKVTEKVIEKEKENELDLWGRYLATTLKNYPDQIAIRKFKAAVSLSLAKLENGEFDAKPK